MKVIFTDLFTNNYENRESKLNTDSIILISYIQKCSNPLN